MLLTEWHKEAAAWGVWGWREEGCLELAAMLSHQNEGKGAQQVW